MIARLIATFLGTGHLRPASGTWGSAAALPAAWVIASWTGPWGFGLAILLAYGAGLWATAQVIRGMEEKDPSIVVIDEVAGQWVALLPVVIGAAHVGADLGDLWPGWLAGFLLFRLFDIWKPWPVRPFDRMKSAFGVMTDDIFAGLLAAICVVALAGLSHGI